MEEIVERVRRQHLSEVEKLCIVAYANLYRDPESRKFIYGCAESVRSRFAISRSCLHQITQDFDNQITEGAIYPDLKPKHSGTESLLTDTIRENLIDLHYLTDGGKQAM